MEFKIKKEALNFRRQNGLSSSDPLEIKSFIRRLGIIAVFAPLSDDFSGMSIKQNGQNFILINSNHSIGRQNFTVCHELYHLYLDEDFTPHKCATGKFNARDKVELHADTFASYLLCPEEGILDRIPAEELECEKISIGTILELEHSFACSRAALLRRLQKLKLITTSQKEELRINIKLSARENGYPIDIYESGNKGLVIGAYGSIAKSLFDGEHISEGHYLELMRAIGIDFNECFKDE